MPENKEFKIYFYKSRLETIFVFLTVKTVADTLSGEEMIGVSDQDNYLQIIHNNRIIYDHSVLSSISQYDTPTNSMFNHLKSAADTDVAMFYLKKYFKKGIDNYEDVDVKYKFALGEIKISELDFLSAYINFPEQSIESKLVKSQSDELKKFIKAVYICKKGIVKK